MRHICQLLVLPALASVALGACGSGSTASSTETSASAAASPAGAWVERHRGGQTARDIEPTRKDSAGADGAAADPMPADSSATKAFTRPGADNSIQESGSEASDPELAQAAAALHAYLDARADEAWGRACSQLAAGMSASLGQIAAGSPAGGGKQLGCPQILAATSAGMPAYLRRDLTEARPGALRVDGKGAFLLFHGAHDTDYFMPMAREAGRWKVAAIAASPLG